MKEQLSLALSSEPPRRARTAALRFAHFRSSVTVGEAIARNAVASRQDRRVLAVFRPGDRLTPSQVHGLLCDETGPPAPLLTSIRRSLTNLAKRGQLAHYPGDRRPGPHGATESVWSLA